MKLHCESHGKLLWIGHGRCICCGRQYKHLLDAPDVCACGSRLQPSWLRSGMSPAEMFFEADDDEKAFSGRPECGLCFNASSLD